MKKYLLLLTLLSIFVVGCNTTNTNPPGGVYQPPPQQIQTQEPNITINDTVVAPQIDTDFAYLWLNDEIISIFDLRNGTASLINCGNAAEGPWVASEFLSLQKPLKYLIMTNISSDTIGGCVSVLQTIYDFEQIHVFGQERHSALVNDTIKWVAPQKVYFHDNEWNENDTAFK